MKFNLQQIPREIVYICLIICLSIPFIWTWELPIFISNASRGVYDSVEKVHAENPKKPVFLLSCWSPGTKGENRPQLLAVVKHLVRLRHPFIIFSPILEPIAPKLAEDVVNEVIENAKHAATTNGLPFNYEYGQDYVHLGFKGITGPTIAPMVQGLDADLQGLLIKDFYGTPIEDIPIMDGFDSLGDSAMIVTVGDGAQGEDLIGVFSNMHPDIPIAVGGWSLVCTKLYPYLDSKQLCGILDGLNGASEYLAILNPKMGSSRRINSLSLGRSLLILLIIIGNIGMLVDHYRKRRGLPVAPPPEPPIPGEKRWVNIAMVIFSISFVLLLLVELIWNIKSGNPFEWQRMGLWVAAYCTIGMLSFAFGDNKLYRILEHVIIGSGAAYGAFAVIDKQFYPNFVAKIIGGVQSIGAEVPAIDGGVHNLWWLIVLIPSAFWFTVYFKKIAWTNKIVVGLLMGVTVGISFEKFTNLCIPQILSSFKPIVIHTLNGWSINYVNFIYILTMILVLLYFVFCFKRKSTATKGVTRLGRMLMMIAFGAVFGNTIATRMTWLIDRLETLTDWILQMPFWS